MASCFSPLFSSCTRTFVSDQQTSTSKSRRALLPLCATRCTISHVVPAAAPEPIATRCLRGHSSCQQGHTRALFVWHPSMYGWVGILSHSARLLIYETRITCKQPCRTASALMHELPTDACKCGRTPSLSVRIELSAC
jgi:hypothetical protein